MKNIRTILIVVSILYIITTIILLMSEEKLYNNLNLLNLLDYFKYWMVVGVFLLTGLIIVGSLYIRHLKKQYRQLDLEHAGVKAKYFDLEQSRKTEDELAGKRIEAFRQSLDKGGRPADPNAPQH